MWIILALTIGGVVGYLAGAFCASVKNVSLDRRNLQLFYTLAGLVAAVNSGDQTRIAPMLKISCDVLREDYL